MKKLIIITLLVCGLTVFSNAANPDDNNRKGPIYHGALTFLYGRDFNMGGNDYPEVFGHRPSSIGNFACRYSYYSRWNVGGYVQLHLPTFRDFDPVIHGLETEGEMIDGGLTNLILEAGVAYRHLVKRWEFIAHLGACFEGAPQFNPKTTITPDGEYGQYSEEWWVAVYSQSIFRITGGLGAGYRISKKISLIFDMTYRHPIGKPTGADIRHYRWDEANQNKTLLDNEHYVSHSWGKDFNVSLGVQININAGSD